MSQLLTAAQLILKDELTDEDKSTYMRLTNAYLTYYVTTATEKGISITV